MNFEQHVWEQQRMFQVLHIISVIPAAVKINRNISKKAESFLNGFITWGPCIISSITVFINSIPFRLRTPIVGSGWERFFFGPLKSHWPILPLYWSSVTPICYEKIKFILRLIKEHALVPFWYSLLHISIAYCINSIAYRIISADQVCSLSLFLGKTIASLFLKIVFVSN